MGSWQKTGDDYLINAYRQRESSIGPEIANAFADA